MRRQQGQRQQQQHGQGQRQRQLRKWGRQGSGSSGSVMVVGQAVRLDRAPVRSMDGSGGGGDGRRRCNGRQDTGQALESGRKEEEPGLMNVCFGDVFEWWSVIILVILEK